ncbi:MAG: ZPR1 zinc finger domain-containing protein [Candidatus Hecatellaceae archaeon]
MAERPPEAELGACPICRRGQLTITYAEENIPGFGRLLLLTYRCASCGYRVTDVMALEAKEPATYKALVENPSDLKIKVVRSSSGFIEIPELGVEIRPGPASQGYITNVEGLLLRIEEAASTLRGDRESEGRLQAFLEKLRLAAEGKISFTVILKDPSGNSALISESPGKVERIPLSREEAEELKRQLAGIAFEHK